MSRPLRTLVLDDSPEDAEFMARELSRAGFAPEMVRVATQPEFVRRLGEDFQIALLDFHLPGFNGMGALELLKQHAPHLPCIMVSGLIGDETAAECIRRGAFDYVLKDRLQRLGAAVQNALEHARLEAARRQAESELRKVHERLNLMVRVTGMVAGTRSLANQAEELVGQVRRAFEADACVALALEGDDLPLLACSSVERGRFPEKLRAGDGFVQAVLARQQAVEVQDAERDPVIAEMFAGQDGGTVSVSGAGAPMLIDDCPVGVLAVFCLGEKRFNATDLDHLQVAANHLAVALANDRLYTRIRCQQEALEQEVSEREHAEQLSAAFARLGRQLSAATNPEEAAEIVAEIAREMLGWDSCSLDLFEPEGNLLETVLMMDLVEGERRKVVPRETLRPASALAKRVLTEGPQLILRGPRPEFSEELDPFGDTARPSASLMFVPLEMKGGMMGVLTIQSYRPNAYTPEDLKTLSALAGHCTAAFDRIYSQQEFQNIFQHALDGICRSSLDGRILSANPAMAQLLRQESAEELIRQITDVRTQVFARPPDYDRYVRMLETRNHVRQFETEFRRTGGERIWVSINGRALRHSGGKVVCYESIVEDITELKLAVETLRETEQTYRRAIAAIGAVPYSCEIGADRYTFIGEGITNLTGCSTEEMTPQVWEGMIQDAVVRGEGAGLTWHEAVQRHQSGQIRNWKCDVRIRTRDGQSRWISDGAVPLLDERNQVTGFVGVLQDITERKEAEQKIREQASLLDLASDAICLTNMNQDVVFWNRGAERIYGWPASEAIGKNVTELLFKGDSAKPGDVIKSLIRNQQWSGEGAQFKRTGQEIMVASRWTLVRNDKGQPRGILIMGSDVTEKKRLESQFLRAQRLESIGTLASGIAHDLNNVLAPILMSVDLLGDSATGEAERSILSSMETSAKRGAEIVRHLLTFARGIEGKRVLIQPKHLIAELATILRGTIPKDITVKTSTPTDLWVVPGDSTQLHQVLLNLCVNARDAMAGGGSLRIAASNVELDEQYTSMSPEAKPGPYVRIDVTDTGSGIPPEHLDKIFDPFFTTKEPGMGTGLGLSSSIGIVKSHGGFVTVQSKLNEGTAFAIFLPAKPSEQQEAPAARKARSDQGAGEFVLVVDDEASIRRVTQRTLEARGYRTLTAEDGAQALALFVQRREELDIVVTDLAMPFMDGVALVRAIKKMRPQTRIIVSTGHGQSDKIAELKAMGLRTFLNKPYTADRLLSALREELRLP